MSNLMSRHIINIGTNTIQSPSLIPLSKTDYCMPYDEQYRHMYFETIKIEMNRKKAKHKVQFIYFKNISPKMNVEIKFLAQKI